MKESTMLLSEIEEKDVINVVTGERIGYVSSVRINIESGAVVAVAVERETRLVSFFAKEEEMIMVPWSQILKIGEDVIIVNMTEKAENIKESRR